MDTLEYGFRSLQELLELPSEYFGDITAEERRESVDRLNRAIDETVESYNQVFFGLCPGCKARRREVR